MTSIDAATTYRPTLFSIAYRMTGEVMVSEDIVQEAILHWMSRSSETIQDTKAYLAKSVINGSLNHLSQVKRQRDVYKGIWLPEPVLATHHVSDARLDISYGLMLLLEKLSPMERAVFVLRESFDFAYSELADLFDTNEANSRQLYRRAKEKISGTNRRFTIDPQQQQALMEAFATASETGNIETLIQLLKADVALYSDGGGKVSAAINPLFGRLVIEKFLRGLDKKQSQTQTIRAVMVNGEPAIVRTHQDGQLIDTVMVLEFDDLGINGIYIIRNPDKLAHLQ